ncbi:dipeptidase [Paracraurococcus lichenis]|uniref:Membrane dipeptidase n=1 Tax=Paracraurococcus lichenis TaxID=3064888 RepID=A0ABT9DZF3_9PROT|nr:membrane dipeptidase [Paracraurococcus sp. LOR1-02]MDO9709286.1 membrane dipeptidase [Paracraurococcus sp. LOR1-02]
MQLPWDALATGHGLPPPGATVELEGVAFAPQDMPRGYAILLPEAACCLGCRPDPAMAVEVLFADEAPAGPGPHRLAGTWHALPAEDPTGWRWQLRGARALPSAAAPGPWLRRRALLAAGPLLCAAAACAEAPAPSPAARALVEAAAPMDLHSHAGHVILSRTRLRPFDPVAAPMREGGMRLIALAMVADSPTTTVTPDRRIEAYRSPAPGELYAHSKEAFARLAALVAGQGLAVVTDQASLRTALQPGAGPSVVVASEGADWLEGRLERLEEAVQAHRLRHLQLVHYRVNELGDIQTAAPVHEGLTGFGAEVIRACNRLGVVVDVAHGTYWLTQRAAEVTQKPLVLSHTGLSGRPGLRSRWITAEHARLVAATGGVVGVWPLMGAEAPTLRAYAAGIARMVDAVGIEHVGIGSDMLGLLATPAFGDYRETPALAEALLAQGFAPAEAARILGGNYARVLAATLPG